MGDLKCGECQWVNEPGADRCRNCGRPLPSRTTSASEEPPSGWEVLLLWTLLGVGALIAVAEGFLIVDSRHPNRIINCNPHLGDCAAFLYLLVALHMSVWVWGCVTAAVWLYPLIRGRTISPSPGIAIAIVWGTGIAARIVL